MKKLKEDLEELEKENNRLKMANHQLLDQNNYLKELDMEKSVEFTDQKKKGSNMLQHAEKDVGNKQHIQKRKREEDSEGGEKRCSQKVTIGLVEYTKKELYLGTIKDDKFTFTKTKLGRFDGPAIDFKSAKETSYVLQPNDLLKYDKTYLVCEFTSSIISGKIILTEEQKNYIAQSIQKYSRDQ